MFCLARVHSLPAFGGILSPLVYITNHRTWRNSEPLLTLTNLIRYRLNVQETEPFLILEEDAWIYVMYYGFMFDQRQEAAGISSLGDRRRGNNPSQSKRNTYFQSFLFCWQQQQLLLIFLLPLPQLLRLYFSLVSGDTRPTHQHI